MTSTTSRLPGWPSLQPSFEKPKFLNSLRRWGRLSSRLGVDLGTSKTSIYAPEQGIVLQEPSLVALEKNTLTPLAFGSAAQKFVGRHPDHIAVIHPIKYGQIEELELTEMMLRHFLKQVPGRHSMFRPRVSVACNRDAVGIEGLVLQDVLFAAGARRIALVDRAVAAAIGAELPLDDPSGRLIVDIGAGTTEIAVVSQMGSLLGESVRIGGIHLDRAIHHFLRTEHHVLVSDGIAEQIKIKYGSAFASPASEEQEEQRVEVQGLDLISNQCTQVSIRQDIFRAVILPVLGPMVDAIQYVLEQTSPTLVLDIAEHGMVLTGGGALLTGLDQFLGQALNMPVRVAPDPSNAIARGIGYTIENTVPNSKIIAA